MTWLLVALGAGLGSVARYVADRWISEARVGTFPAGTATVNITGSFLLGLLTGALAHDSLLAAALGTGLCGGYTTFSTWAYETWRLVEEGSTSTASVNVVLSVVVGLLAAGAGLALGALV